MKRAFIIFFMILITGLVVNAANEELVLRGYDGIEIPAGMFIRVINLRQISTKTDDDTTKTYFMATNDTYIQKTNIIPSGTKFQGVIEKMNEPVVGTNASMVIKVTKMVLPDGFEIPLRAYIYTANGNKIGGELTQPASWRKHPHYQQGLGLGTLKYTPGPKRKMGEHLTIAAGAELMIVLASPAWITHTLTN